MEPASHVDFPAALKAAGIRPVSSALPENPKGTAASLPDQWQQKLQQLDVAANFSVIKAVHHAIETDGETQQRLGLLARGYAHLVVLTQHQMNTAYAAMAARSMLYAERMLVTAKNDAERELALWHRAYVSNLVGLPRSAQADLQAILKLQSGDKTKRDVTKKPAKKMDDLPPAVEPADPDLNWTRLVKPCCVWDRTALQELADEHEEIAAWARRMRFVYIDFQRNVDPLLENAVTMISKYPMDYGLCAELHKYQTLQTKRTGAYLGPRSMADNLPRSMEQMAGVPDELGQELLESHYEKQIQQKEVRDPNPGDGFSAYPGFAAAALRLATAKELGNHGPTWSALAFLVEEEQFLQTAHFLHTLTDATESSYDKEIDSVVPLVRGHRYQGYLESFRYRRKTEPEAYRNTLKDVVLEDPRNSKRIIADRFWKIKDDSGVDLYASFRDEWRMDFTAYSFIELFFPYSTSSLKFDEPARTHTWANRMVSVIPHSEIGWRMLIQSGFAPDEKELKRWQANIHTDPRALVELAEFFEKRKEFDKAIDYFEKSLELLPTLNASSHLANLYFEQKDYDSWERTLLDFQDVSKSGMGTARAAEYLAWGFMRRGLWDQARPHAEVAANTYSTWGLRCASVVAEGQADWAASEKWIRAMSRSYPTGAGWNWYFWCRRTGRGELETARTMAKQYFARPTTNFSRNDWVRLGVYHLLENDPAEALEAYQDALKVKTSLTCACMIAQLSRQQGDDETRLAVIDKMQKENQAVENPGAGELMVEQFIELLTLGENDDEEQLLLSMEDGMRGSSTTDVGAYCYLIGLELAARKKDGQAETWYRRSLNCFPESGHYAALAGAKLVQLHDTSRADEEPLTEKDLWPAPRLATSR